ncbi:MAG: hypothetical protein GY702_19645 [Desulfobulbaceae bacterium]|nr:hypothetical protein [Desulfobulbaceae bacterium]
MQNNFAVFFKELTYRYILSCADFSWHILYFQLAFSVLIILLVAMSFQEFQNPLVNPALEFLQDPSFNLGPDLEVLRNVEVQRRRGNVLSFQDAFSLPSVAPISAHGQGRDLMTFSPRPVEVADPWEHTLLQADIQPHVSLHNNYTVAHHQSTPIVFLLGMMPH